MDCKTALRGPNASAAPLASSTTNAARPRARSTLPLSLTSSGQYGLECCQNTEAYPQSSQTGRDHEHPRRPDHHLMYVQERSLGVAERPIPGLRPPSDYKFPSLSQRSGDRGCCDRVARSGLPWSPLAMLSEQRISTSPNSYSRLHSLVLSLSCPGVGVEAFGVGPSC